MTAPLTAEQTDDLLQRRQARIDRERRLASVEAAMIQQRDAGVTEVLARLQDLRFKEEARQEADARVAALLADARVERELVEAQRLEEEAVHAQAATARRHAADALVRRRKEQQRRWREEAAKRGKEEAQERREASEAAFQERLQRFQAAAEGRQELAIKCHEQELSRASEEQKWALERALSRRKEQDRMLTVDLNGDRRRQARDAAAARLAAQETQRLEWLAHSIQSADSRRARALATKHQQGRFEELRSRWELWERGGRSPPSHPPSPGGRGAQCHQRLAAMRAAAAAPFPRALPPAVPSQEQACQTRAVVPYRRPSDATRAAALDRRREFRQAQGAATAVLVAQPPSDSARSLELGVGRPHASPVFSPLHGKGAYPSPMPLSPQIGLEYSLVGILPPP